MTKEARIKELEHKAMSLYLENSDTSEVLQMLSKEELEEYKSLMSETLGVEL